MARLTKAARLIEKLVSEGFKTHASGVQINIMDLTKVMNAGRDALRDGRDLDEAMCSAVALYRQN